MTVDQLSVKSLSDSPATGGLGNQGMFVKLKKMLEMASATKRKEPVAVTWLGAGLQQVRSRTPPSPTALMQGHRAFFIRTCANIQILPKMKKPSHLIGLELLVKASFLMIH